MPSGIPFLLAASVVNLAAGAASVLLVWRLLSARAGRRVLHRRMALLASLLWCLYPATAVLQIAYSEALGMALLAAFLCLLLQRRYLWCAVARAAARPHPGGGASARGRGAGPPRPALARPRPRPAAAPLAGQRASAVVMLAATGLSAVAWPLVVGLVTGNLRGASS